MPLTEEQKRIIELDPFVDMIWGNDFEEDLGFDRANGRLSEKRLYHSGQILSPRKLKEGMKVVEVYDQRAFSSRRLKTVTRVDMKAGMIFFAEDHVYSGGRHFADCSLVRYYTGVWNNGNRLEYPTV